MLADEALANAAAEVDRVDTVAGCELWSATYDRPNSAFDLDEPVVKEILDSLPVGVALDTACGTGRHAQLLAERGHRVIGVDGSPDVLARARTRVPQGEFLLGDLVHADNYVHTGQGAWQYSRMTLRKDRVGLWRSVRSERVRQAEAGPTVVPRQ